MLWHENFCRFFINLRVKRIDVSSFSKIVEKESDLNPKLMFGVSNRNSILLRYQNISDLNTCICCRFQKLTTACCLVISSVNICFDKYNNRSMKIMVCKLKWKIGFYWIDLSHSVVMSSKQIKANIVFFPPLFWYLSCSDLLLYLLMLVCYPSDSWLCICKSWFGTDLATSTRTEFDPGE